jgi:hypothetical protein
MNDRSNWPSQLTTLTKQDNHSGLENTTADQRVGMMWELAVQAWAMKGQVVAEQEFQRHIGGIEFRRG